MERAGGGARRGRVKRGERQGDRRHGPGKPVAADGDAHAPAGRHPPIGQQTSSIPKLDEVPQPI